MKSKGESVLRKKIKYLEDELVRKDSIITKLKEENKLLFKTAMKNSEHKILSTK